MKLVEIIIIKKIIKKIINKKFFSFLIILRIKNQKKYFFTNIFLKNVFILFMV